MSGQRAVYSIFPGIDLLGRAFMLEGFFVCRGSDPVFGGDVREDHPPAGLFDGVIGGDPCQAHSALVNIVRAVHGEESVAEDMTPEYERIVAEAQPAWFLRENAVRAPTPRVPGYVTRDVVLNNRLFGGEQNRERRFWFGTPDGRALDASSIAASVGVIRGAWEPAVCSTAGGRRASVAIGGSGKPKGNQGRGDGARLRNRTLAHELALQGLPSDWLDRCPLTAEGKRRAVGNGVPILMGRALARAVRAAMYPDLVSESA